MAEWMFDGQGKASFILDENKVRDSRVQVVGWINGSNVYSLNGNHIGWFEGGVIYDSENNALAFTRNRTGSLPSVPEIGGAPGMPGFSGIPGRPGFSGTQGKPGLGGWSRHNAETYFA